MVKEMKYRVTITDLTEMIASANDPTSAIRSLIPYYQYGAENLETNTFILSATVEHFRANNKPSGVYKLGHGLELVLGEHSEVWQEPPF